MTKQVDPIEKSIPPQEWTKYNRESGRKTLYFVGVIITLVAVLTVAILILFFKK